MLWFADTFKLRQDPSQTKRLLRRFWHDLDATTKWGAGRLSPSRTARQKQRWFRELAALNKERLIPTKAKKLQPISQQATKLV